MLGTCDGVSISGTYSVPSCSHAVSLGEGHELGLGQISLEAILVEPFENLLIVLDGRGGGGFLGGGGGIYGTIIDIQ